MRQISDHFKNMAFSPIKTNFYADIVLEDGLLIKTEDGFLEWRIIHELNYASSAMAQATIVIRGERDLIDRRIKLRFGYRFEQGLELLEFGPFIVHEQSYDVKSDKTSALAFDLMIAFCKPVDLSGLNLPMNLQEVKQHVGLKAGVPTNLFSSEFIVDEDRYTDSGHEYRSFLEDGCELENRIILLKDGVLTDLSKNETDVILDKTSLKRYSFEPVFGPVDSLVLSRYPQEDNVYAADDPGNSSFEVKFYDNLLVDRNREEIIDSIYLKYKGMELHPFEAETLGFGFLELGDLVTALIDGDSKELTVYGLDLKVTNNIFETIYCKEPKKTSTQYHYATTSERRQKQTDLTVDKQTAKIEATISRIEEFEDKITTNSSQLTLLDDRVSTQISALEDNLDGVKSEVNNTFEMRLDGFSNEYEVRITDAEGKLETMTSLFQYDATVPEITLGGSDEQWDTHLKLRPNSVRMETTSGAQVSEFGSSGMFNTQWSNDTHIIKSFQEGSIRGTLFQDKGSGS